MYNYVQNKYNTNPSYFKENDFKKNHLYIKFIQSPILKLPDNEEEFLKTHKKKFWYNIKRSLRLYEEKFGTLKFQICRDSNSIKHYMPQVYTLFNRKWANEYSSSEWKKQEGFQPYTDALIDLAHSNGGFLATLTDVDNKLLSYAYCLNTGDTVFFYQFTSDDSIEYRKYSIGKILIYKLLLETVKSKRYKYFDFMNGVQPYKLEWTKSVEWIYYEVGRRSLVNLLKMILLKFKFFVQFHPQLRPMLKRILKVVN